MDADQPDTAQALNDPTLFVFFNEIGIIDQLARSAFERVLPKGLTVPQFSVLNHFVRLGGPRTPAQLASAFQVSRATMTNTLKRLEQSALIAVARDPNDGRSKQITITQQGRDAREQSIAALAPLLTDFAERLDLADVARIIPALQTVRIELDSSRDVADRISASQAD